MKRPGRSRRGVLGFLWASGSGRCYWDFFDLVKWPEVLAAHWEQGSAGRRGKCENTASYCLTPPTDSSPGPEPWRQRHLLQSAAPHGSEGSSAAAHLRRRRTGRKKNAGEGLSQRNKADITQERVGGPRAEPGGGGVACLSLMSACLHLSKSHKTSNVAQMSSPRANGTGGAVFGECL